MAITRQRQRPSLQSALTLSSDQLKFELPNPGDIFLVVAFAWSTVCFLMVTIGPQLASRAATLTASKVVRDMLLTEQTAIGVLMVVGILGLATAFWLINRYPNIAKVILLYAMTTANANWVPIHDSSFALKYLLILYLGTFSLLFFIKNAWRLINEKFYRLYVMYLGWIAFVVLLNGMKVGDIWYLGTEFTLMIGVGIAWCMNIKTREDLLQINRLFAVAAIPVTFLHVISPLVINDVLVGGRFVSMFIRATGFATIYSVFVVIMFWMAMYEKRGNIRRLFFALAMLGFGMLLLSGTRNAVVAAMCSFLILWWVFRSSIFIYIGIVGAVAVLVQSIIGPGENFDMLGDRLGSLENTRLGAWQLYLGLIADSPVYGYGFENLSRAVYNDQIVNLVSNFRRITVPAVHNNYIGFGVRWGLVGLALQLGIYYFAFLKAWLVIFSTKVPSEDKKVYVLPVALLALVALEGLFEDTMAGTGKGTIHNVIYAICPIILYMHGGRLLLNAEQAKEARTSNVQLPSGRPRLQGTS